MNKKDKISTMNRLSTTQLPSLYVRLSLILMAMTIAGAVSENGDRHAYCNAGKPEPLVTVNPDADLFIAVLLPVHEMDERGLYSCGPISADGVTVYEAVRWTLDVINMNDGVINGLKKVDRLVPGIKIGAKIYDSCGHQELAINSLIELYPTLSYGGESGSIDSHRCPPGSRGSELSTIAVLDGTSLALNRPKVTEATIASFVPLVPLSPSASIPPNTGAKVLAKILANLEWTRVAIIHSNDESALFLVKSLGQLAISGAICLVDGQDLPPVSSSPLDYSGTSGSGAELRAFNQTLNLLLSHLDTNDKNVPILVIGDGEPIRRLVRVMDGNAAVFDHQWLFVSLLSPALIDELEPIARRIKIMTLAPYPAAIKSLRRYWQNGFAGDRWFDEFVSAGHECRSNCSTAAIAWQTWQSLPAIHTTFTLVYALRNAWIDLCAGVAGMCARLARLTRREFVETYLESLTFEHRSQMRSPPELESTRKTLDSRPGEIENLAISLSIVEPNGGLSEAIVYRGDNDVKIVDPKFEFKSSPCPDGGCHRCVKVRQSRVEEQPLDDDYAYHRDHYAGRDSSRKFGLNSGLNTNTGLRRTLGLAIAVISALGVVSVLICVFYFLLVFPVAVGTTVLGYQILLGLFGAFAVNFAFLLPTTFAVCWLRRLGLSLSYTVIISGLLVKVMNTWRLLAIKNRSQQLKLSSPTGLLVISSGLVALQIAITLVWLFTFPPNPGLYNSQWTCSVSASTANVTPVFDSEIVVSLLYVTLLLLITIFFAALTWKCYDQNREPRWIMVCCAATAAIWLAWLLAMSGGHTDHHMSIACANLLNASLVMILLYVRKLYLFTKISRQVRRERQLKTAAQRLHQHEPFAGQHQLYGALKSAPIIWVSSQRSAASASATATPVSQLRGATRPPFEADYGPDDNVSSCGSVKSNASAQVQGHDLYPMDVYDGGSQFAPLSSLLATKSVYGPTDDTTSFW